MRPLPLVLPETEAFWTGGREGRLCIKRCPACARLWHPSQTVCAACHHRELEPAAVSGRGTVVGFTINHQQWLPDPAPPYVVAIVALDDDPRVRLTTNIVDAEPDDVHVGLRVQVRFEQQEDVWLPLFAPTSDGGGDAARRACRGAAARSRRPPESERRPVRGPRRDHGGRHVRRRPAADAPAARAHRGRLPRRHRRRRAQRLRHRRAHDLARRRRAAPPASPRAGSRPVANALDIRPTWHHAGMETPGHSGAVVAAMMAVASGLCRHVLCYRTVWESTATELMRSGRLAPPAQGRIDGDFQWLIPFGAASAANWIAMYASQYFHQFGGDREMLGRIALNARANAAHNPAAIYRDPLTMDDYLDARMISTPFGLYDCDVPCDGAIALVVSAVDAAADAPNPIVGVEAVGTQVTERVSWDQGTVTHEPLVFGPAAHLWSRTDLTTADVDVAEIYDGFTFNCVSWLEALGFCDLGEAPAFLAGGTEIALDGSLPLNTHGGQLSAGRTQGFGFLHEAVVQLRGAGGARQVDGAEVAVVTTGGGVPGGAMLLTRAR